MKVAGDEFYQKVIPIGSTNMPRSDNTSSLLTTTTEDDEENPITDTEPPGTEASIFRDKSLNEIFIKQRKKLGETDIPTPGILVNPSREIRQTFQGMELHDIL